MIFDPTLGKAVAQRICSVGFPDYIIYNHGYCHCLLKLKSCRKLTIQLAVSNQSISANFDYEVRYCTPSVHESGLSRRDVVSSSRLKCEVPHTLRWQTSSMKSLHVYQCGHLKVYEMWAYSCLEAWEILAKPL